MARARSSRSMTAGAMPTGAPRATAITSAMPIRPTPGAMGSESTGSPGSSTTGRASLFHDALRLQEFARDVLRLHLFAVDLVVHLRNRSFVDHRAGAIQHFG